MKLFVTGGTGFVGSHFLQQALGAGHEIVALRRPGSQSRIPLSRQPQWLDRRLDDDMADHLPGCDAVVHLASHTPNPPYAPLDECIYWNVYAPLKLANQAFSAGVLRYVIAGSCFEYGPGAARFDHIPVTAPCEPSLSYPISKAAASVAFAGFARERQISLKILRIFQVFGPGEQASRLWPSLREAALRGADFDMTAGEQMRDFVRVEDVALAFLNHLASADAKPGIPSVHHVASGTPQSLRHFCEYWWQHWKATGQLNVGAIPYRSHEMMRLVPEV